MTDRLRYSIADRLIHIQVEGDYTPTTFLQLAGAALADPAAPEKALVLIDARKATAERSYKEVRHLSRVGSKRANRIERVAVLVSHDLQFGIIRMASILVEDFGIEMEPFRDVAEAYQIRLTQSEGGPT